MGGLVERGVVLGVCTASVLSQQTSVAMRVRVMRLGLGAYVRRVDLVHTGVSGGGACARWSRVCCRAVLIFPLIGRHRPALAVSKLLQRRLVLPLRAPVYHLFAISLAWQVVLDFTTAVVHYGQNDDIYGRAVYGRSPAASCSSATTPSKLGTR